MRPRVTAWMVAAALAGVAVAAAVGSAGAAPQTVTLGSVSGTPSGNICTGMINCTYVPFNNVSDPELVVPFDGTVTSFSVNGNAGKVELRVLRPAGSGQFTGVGTSPAETLSTPGVNTFMVSLPVKQGDVLGLDNDSSSLMFDTSSSTPLTAYYELPSLADGNTAAPNQPARTGYRLLLTAVVQSTGTTTTGTTGTTGTTTTTTTTSPPTLTKVAQAHRTWREGSKLAKFASGSTPPVGTTFRFTVNESVRVRFVFKQRGRKRGTLSFSATAGAHKLRFQGRLSKHKRLKPGRYTVSIIATNAAGQSASTKLKFTIVAP